eukprot:135043-Prymnesium_polylepis.1
MPTNRPLHARGHRNPPKMRTLRTPQSMPPTPLVTVHSHAGAGSMPSPGWLSSAHPDLYTASR